MALRTVTKYNSLMKDFPLNDLLSATELEQIPRALIAIFVHLKNVHPVQMALLEAISRDLSSLMRRLLATRQLANIPFDKFEKVSIYFGVMHC